MHKVRLHLNDVPEKVQVKRIMDVWLRVIPRIGESIAVYCEKEGFSCKVFDILHYSSQVSYEEIPDDNEAYVFIYATYYEEMPDD